MKKLLSFNGSEDIRDLSKASKSEGSTGSGSSTISIVPFLPEKIERLLAQKPASPVFHSCPKDPVCPYCSNSSSTKRRFSFDWSFLDGIYCISLKSREDRALAAAVQFHQIGLCRSIQFYRPIKHPKSIKHGIWESHRAVAIDAINKGYNKIMTLEDDVLFLHSLRPEKVKTIQAALNLLPADWMIFYLGHWPLWAYFIRPNIIRTGSMCAHAYIASRRLMEWLNDHPYLSSGRTPKAPHIIGAGIDSAYSKLDKAYALFPMIAIQSSSRSDNKKLKKKKGKLHHFIRHSKHREWLLSNLMRPNEFVVTVISALIFWPFSLFKLVQKNGK
jgi:hypothetical protein